MANHKIKLIKNKEGQDGPQYSVTYKTNPRTCPNYAILTALAGDRDVVMIMNTDLMFGAEGKERRLFEEFLELVKDRGLSHFKQSVPSSKQFSIFGMVLNKARKTKQEAQEIAVYIPNAVWRQADFGPFLPTCGVQYYMTDTPMDGGETVARILDMPEEEKAELFSMDVYDIALLGQIGINARDMEEEDLRRVLESI